MIHRLYDMARAQAATVDKSAPFAGVPFLLKELGSSWAGAPNTNSCFYLKDVVADLRHRSRAPHEGGRIAACRQIQCARERMVDHHRTETLRRNEEPMAEGITPGGSSGGCCCGHRLAHGADRRGQRRRRLDPHPRLLLRHRRPETVARPRHLAPFGDYWYGGAYFLCCSRTVRDTAAYLDAVAGALPGDAYTPPVPDGSWLGLSSRAPKKLRIGYSVTPPDGTAIDPEVKADGAATRWQLSSVWDTMSKNTTWPLDADEVWKTYTNMTCVQTAATFGYHETVIGRPVTPDDVEPVTWAIIERGRATSGIRHISDVERLRQVGRDIVGDLAPYDLFVTPTLTQLPRPFGYYDMSETGHRPLQRQMGGRGLRFPLQHVRPAGNLAAAGLVRRRRADRRATRRPLRRRSDGPGRLRAAGARDAVAASPAPAVGSQLRFLARRLTQR